MRTIRWPIAILVTVAVAIGYLDRQTLSLTFREIQANIAITAGDKGTLLAWFYFAYAIMYVGGGRLIDAMGTRRGFLVIVVWWSLACAAHGLATSLWMLAVARVLLGLAQGGVFPAGAKAVAEWFPVRERATAMGMINGGSSVGAVLAPPLVALMLLYAHWPWVYYACGAVGLLWTVWWLWEYYPPGQHPRLSSAERHEIEEVLAPVQRNAGGIAWSRLLLYPQVWGMVLGKFCCDAIWFTYSSWMPIYLGDVRGFGQAQMAAVAWIPYAASGLGSVAGGWFSGWLLARGHALGFSRKAVLGVSAALMPCMLLVTRVSVAVDIAMFSLAFCAHLSFSTLVITLPADLFPRRIVGSVVGLVGFGGSMGGALFNVFAGFLVARLGTMAGYPLLFAIGSTFHILGFLCILWTIPQVQPLVLPEQEGEPALATAGEIP